MTALSVQDLSIGFRRPSRVLGIVDRVSFDIHPATCVALVGESGSGKSLTALGLMRLLPPGAEVTSGRVCLGDDELLGLPAREMRRRRGRDMAMIFQDPMTTLNPVVRIGDQLTEVLSIHERVSSRAGRTRAAELLKQVGVPDALSRLDSYPHQLSGGQKQRVVIAMALMMRPRLLILDEPTTALDVTIQAQIVHLLRDLMAEFRVAMLLISHDLGVVRELAHRVLVMYAGRVVEEATTEEFVEAPLHPYSSGLLRAHPAHASSEGRLFEIPGAVPNPSEYVEGCRFAARCPKRANACAGRPDWVQLASGRRVACFFPEAEA